MGNLLGYFTLTYRVIPMSTLHFQRSTLRLQQAPGQRPVKGDESSEITVDETRGFFWFRDYRGLKQVISNICYINGIFADIWLIFMR